MLSNPISCPACHAAVMSVGWGNASLILVLLYSSYQFLDLSCTMGGVRWQRCLCIIEHLSTLVKGHHSFTLNFFFSCNWNTNELHMVVWARQFYLR